MEKRNFIIIKFSYVNKILVGRCSSILSSQKFVLCQLLLWILISLQTGLSPRYESLLSTVRNKFRLNLAGIVIFVLQITYYFCYELITQFWQHLWFLTKGELKIKGEFLTKGEFQLALKFDVYLSDDWKLSNQRYQLHFEARS